MAGFIFAFCLLLAGIAHAHPLSPQIINPENHHVYLLLDAATWKASEAEAVKLGGHLATIRDQVEEDWVFKTFGSYGGQQHLLWIGLSDTAKKFHFSWSSDESASYTSWAPGEPNNVGNGEDFVAIYYPNHDQRNKWNDWSNRVTDPIGLPMNGVVEIVPPEAAAATNPDVNLMVVAISPTLIITNDSGSIKLQWPVSATNYLLEATADLSQPFTMFGYSETTNTDLGVYFVIITNAVPQMFFRLHKP
ncbi:MAG TPA: C-type lectin domain-containing protein [Verrucomicrobiae bacterium]|nr:C-type lectin domain-containing protein [Verrucomicrobiae bacterium]